MTTAEAPARQTNERLADISTLAAMSDYIRDEAARLGLERAAATAEALAAELRIRGAQERRA